jgi:hypothetical protein
MLARVQPLGAEVLQPAVEIPMLRATWRLHLQRQEECSSLTVGSTSRYATAGRAVAIVLLLRRKASHYVRTKENSTSYRMSSTFSMASAAYWSRSVKSLATMMPRTSPSPEI